MLSVCIEYECEGLERRLAVAITVCVCRIGIKSSQLNGDQWPLYFTCIIIYTGTCTTIPYMLLLAFLRVCQAVLAQLTDEKEGYLSSVHSGLAAIVAYLKNNKTLED